MQQQCPAPARLTPAALRLSVRALLTLLVCLLALPAAADRPAQPQDRPTVLATRVDDTITPVIAAHIEDGIREAEREGHAALLVELNTPGGLLTSTREIVQGFFGADVPVIVYVTPSGARAASAGAYITMAAHIAAMAPGTHIGAGTPVTGEGETASEKVVNDSAAFAVAIAEQRGRSVEFADDMVRDGLSVSDREALRRGVTDITAASRTELLAAVDGRTVTLAQGQQTVLHTEGAQIEEYDLGFFGEIRQFLASPELAFLFLSLGTLAVIYELASPGMGFGGIIGVVLLILGFVALSVLPFNAAGLLLLGLAAALFAGEVLTPGVGVFAAGGTVALVLSGVFLFRGETGVDPAVLWPTALVVGGGSLLAGRLAWRARRAPVTSGGDVLIGQEATVAAARGDRAQVLLEGAWWTVRSRDGSPLVNGAWVRVVAREDLDLVVEPAPPPGRSPSHPKESPS
ncbi:NfeD family protein [Streptomyces sp. PR69]|uniref:NfeD family protein n=1 Tax=Streptomyces sp. PR69 TaxID=2984950 RepID=UPI0022656DAF|nr:nodulation protein NfeD [Streptomyces sp. PR69]